MLQDFLPPKRDTWLSNSRWFLGVLAPNFSTSCHQFLEARDSFHEFLDSSGLVMELTDLEIIAFEERLMDEMQAFWVTLDVVRDGCFTKVAEKTNRTWALNPAYFFYFGIKLCDITLSGYISLKSQKSFGKIHLIRLFWLFSAVRGRGPPAAWNSCLNSGELSKI